MSEENIYASPSSTEVSNFDEQSHTPLTLKQKLFSFQGRISRAGYWGYAMLYVGVASLIMYIPLVIIAVITSGFSNESAFTSPISVLMFLIMFLLYIPIMWMSASIIVKRFHDRGKTGWMGLIGLIPYIGGIWILIDCGCFAGQKGKNQYGDDPLLADGKKH